jgi:DNA-binding transcriptional MerR regulator
VAPGSMGGVPGRGRIPWPPLQPPRLRQQPLSGGRSRAAERQQQIRDELAATETDLTKAEEAIERYLLAFENGSMPEATCSQRVQALAEKAAELREHRADLNAEADMPNRTSRPSAPASPRPSTTGTPPRRKTSSPRSSTTSKPPAATTSGRSSRSPAQRRPPSQSPPRGQRFGSCMDRCPRQDSNLRPTV